MWAQLKRIIKPNGAIVLMASQPFTSALIMSNVKMFKYDWTWDKANPSGHLNAKKAPLRRHEHILVFGQGATTYNPVMRTGRLRMKGGRKDKEDQVYNRCAVEGSVNDQYYPTSILDITNANRRERVHPTQKPVALGRYLIRTYTNENETVLDFTAGSGSFGVAAILENRKFIGIELDEGYFKIMENRVASSGQTGCGRD